MPCSNSFLVKLSAMRALFFPASGMKPGGQAEALHSAAGRGGGRKGGNQTLVRKALGSSHLRSSAFASFRQFPAAALAALLT